MLLHDPRRIIRRQSRSIAAPFIFGRAEAVRFRELCTTCRARRLIALVTFFFRVTGVILRTCATILAFRNLHIWRYIIFTDWLSIHDIEVWGLLWNLTSSRKRKIFYASSGTSIHTTKVTEKFSTEKVSTIESIESTISSPFSSFVGITRDKRVSFVVIKSIVYHGSFNCGSRLFHGRFGCHGLFALDKLFYLPPFFCVECGGGSHDCDEKGIWRHLWRHLWWRVHGTTLKANILSIPKACWSDWRYCSHCR